MVVKFVQLIVVCFVCVFTYIYSFVDLKLLQDISLDKKQEIETSIKIKLPDVGNWQNIGNHYGMDPTTLASMNDDNNKAEQVINRLFSAHPELTVFDFCEYLKTINQNNLVTKLSKDLTVPKKGGDPLTEADPLTDDSLNGKLEPKLHLVVF